jgi:hypothetical protein
MLNTRLHAQENENQPIEDTVYKPVHSPKTATLLSLVLPGSGQLYNQRYLKAPIIWGGLFISFKFIVFQTKNYNAYRNAYVFLLQRDTASIADALNNGRKNKAFFGKEVSNGQELVDRYEPFLKEYLFEGKRYYERMRNLSYISAGLIYFLNIIDATVDAHFFDYDIDDDITMRIEPRVYNPYTYQAAIGFYCNFTFN